MNQEKYQECKKEQYHNFKLYDRFKINTENEKVGQIIMALRCNTWQFIYDYDSDNCGLPIESFISDLVSCRTDKDRDHVMTVSDFYYDINNIIFKK